MNTVTATLTTTLTWLAANPIAVAAAIVLVMAIIAALAWWLTRTLRTTAKATARTVRTKTNLVMAGIAALLASGLSAEGMWRFMGHDLEIHGPARGVFFVFFEFLMFAFAILSRSHRIRQIANTNSPPTMGSDGLGVWLVAILIGYFAASDAATTPAAVARFAVPLAAAWMWERALIGELADRAGVDPALVRTTIRRALASIRRATRHVTTATQRLLARAGIIAPTGQSATEAVEARWVTKLVRIHIAMTAAAESNRDNRVAKLAARYRRHVMRANALGILTSPAAQQRLVEAVARVDRATDAIDRSRLRSVDVWGIPTDRPTTSPTEWTIYAIDNSSNQPIDRSTEHATDRPTDTIDGEIVPPSIDPPAPTVRPTDHVTDRSTDRPAIKPSTTRPRKRRSKEENERIVIAALQEILGHDDEVPFPSQGEIARIGNLSKSTVGGYLGREDITQEPVLTQEIIDQLTNK